MSVKQGVGERGEKRMISGCLYSTIERMESSFSRMGKISKAAIRRAAQWETYEEFSLRHRSLKH